jgi:hypothetical protein
LAIASVCGIWIAADRQVLTMAEKLDALTRRALLSDHYILTLPNDLETLKSMGLDAQEVMTMKCIVSQHIKAVCYLNADYCISVH